MRRSGPLTTVRWWPGLLVATLLHAIPIVALLPSHSESATRPDAAPLVVMLAAPATLSAPPSDAAVASHASPERTPRAPKPDRTPPVIRTASGTLAANPPMPQAPPEKMSVADASRAATAPPPIPAPPGAQVSARAEGGDRLAQAEVPTWESQVAARLERAKRFPASARLAREEDIVIVSFTVDPDGRTLHARIRRSAGYQDLEDETLSLIARVSPLPTPPNHDARQLTVPIEFHIDR